MRNPAFRCDAVLINYLTIYFIRLTERKKDPETQSVYVYYILEGTTKRNLTTAWTWIACSASHCFFKTTYYPLFNYLIFKRSVPSTANLCWKKALCPPFSLLVWTVANMICLQWINSFHWDTAVFVWETMSCLPKHLFDYQVIVFLDKGRINCMWYLAFQLTCQFYKIISK